MRSSEDVQLARVGLYLEHSGLPLAESVEWAVRAEAAGLDLIAAGDGFADNFALMGAMASRTRTIGLVSAIVNWTRSPVTTAVGARTIAALAPGRYTFGVGAMARHWSERWHGIPGDRPAARLREFTTALRLAWGAEEGQPIDFVGDRYEVRDYAPLMPLGPVPRLAIAAARPHVSRLAGELADTVIMPSVLPASAIAGTVLPAVHAGATRAGRAPEDVEVGVVALAAIADRGRAALDLVRATVAQHVPMFADVLAGCGYGDAVEAVCGAGGDASGATLSDALLRELALVGTPDEVRAQLQRFDGLADWIVLMPAVGLSAHDSTDQVARIVELLAP